MRKTFKKLSLNQFVDKQISNNGLRSVLGGYSGGSCYCSTTSCSASNAGVCVNNGLNVMRNNSK